MVGFQHQFLCCAQNIDEEQFFVFFQKAFIKFSGLLF